MTMPYYNSGIARCMLGARVDGADWNCSVVGDYARLALLTINYPILINIQSILFPLPTVNNPECALLPRARDASQTWGSGQVRHASHDLGLLPGRNVCL